MSNRAEGVIGEGSNAIWQRAEGSHATLAIPAWKRPLDILCVMAASPVWLPLMGLIAIGIKLFSKGPILFRQERIGYMGRPFTCLKFRSMHVNATTSEHEKYLSALMNGEKPMVKLDSRGDRRLIPLGALLRATGLDELPQLINVLRGEMSLVGPRPCTRYEFQNYQPSQVRRFNGLPGLTGLWQVSGKNNTTFRQMVCLDIEYLDRMSPWGDLKIMFLTVPALAEQVLEAQSKKPLN